MKVVKDSPTFVKLLQCHDVIIIDCPTTTLLQAIATKKPVFALLHHAGYTEQMQTMLARRAVCANQAEELMKLLRSYLQSGIYPADLNDDAFCKAYGNHLNNGRSTDRAVHLLNKYVFESYSN